MSGPFLAGVVAGYGIAVPVGAIAVLVAGLSARVSLRVGAAAGLGAATADGVYALIAVAGGAAVAQAVAPITGPLRWAGSVVLLGLAAWTVRGALHRPEAPADPGAGPATAGSGARPAAAGSGARPAGEPAARPAAATPGAGMATALRAYAGVLALTMLNPVTVVYFAALVLGRGGAGGGALFVAGAFLASASWQLLIAGGGSLIGRLITGERGRMITALVSGVVMAVLALLMIAG